MARPRSGLPTKRSTSYRVPTDLEKKLDQLLDTKEFNSQSEIITAALRFWFDNRGRVLESEKAPEEQFKNWARSPEGKAIIAEEYQQARMDAYEKLRGSKL